MLIRREEVEEFLKIYENKPSFSVNEVYFDFQESKKGKRPHGQVPGSSHKRLSDIFEELLKEGLLESDQGRYKLTPKYLKKWEKPKSDVEILKNKERSKYPKISFEDLLWKEKVGVLLLILQNLWSMKKFEVSPEAIYKYFLKTCKNKNNVFKFNGQKTYIIIRDNVKVSIKDFLDQLSFIKAVEKIKENTYRLTPKIFERFSFSITKEYEKEKKIQFDIGFLLSSLLFLLFSFISVSIFPFITSDWYVWKVWNEIYFLLFLTWFLLLIVILIVRRKKIFDYYISPIFKWVRHSLFKSIAK